MSNKEKFLKLVSGEDTQALEELKWRIANKHWLKESKLIAVKILAKLDDLNLSQKDLAEMMGVSPQQINKIVKGNQNLTLDTIAKLQEVLQIPILETFKLDTTNNISSDEHYVYSLGELDISHFILSEETSNYDMKSAKVIKMKPVNTDSINTDFFEMHG